jgi:hypothetical protein
MVSDERWGDIAQFRNFRAENLADLRHHPDYRGCDSAVATGIGFVLGAVLAEIDNPAAGRPRSAANIAADLLDPMISQFFRTEGMEQHAAFRTSVVIRHIEEALAFRRNHGADPEQFRQSQIRATTSRHDLNSAYRKLLEASGSGTEHVEATLFALRAFIDDVETVLSWLQTRSESPTRAPNAPSSIADRPVGNSAGYCEYCHRWTQHVRKRLAISSLTMGMRRVAVFCATPFPDELWESAHGSGNTCVQHHSVTAPSQYRAAKKRGKLTVGGLRALRKALHSHRRALLAAFKQRDWRAQLQHWRTSILTNAKLHQDGFLRWWLAPMLGPSHHALLEWPIPYRITLTWDKAYFATPSRQTSVTSRLGHDASEKDAERKKADFDAAISHIASSLFPPPAVVRQLPFGLNATIPRLGIDLTIEPGFDSTALHIVCVGGLSGVPHLLDKLATAKKLFSWYSEHDPKSGSRKSCGQAGRKAGSISQASALQSDRVEGEHVLHGAVRTATN